MSDPMERRPRTKHEIISHEVEQIIKEITGQEIPSRTTPLDSLGVDSIAMLDVLTTLEQHFDIVLNENVIREFRTINRIARIIQDVAPAR